MDAAMEHIRKHGSLHTEAILTRDHGRAMRFLREVDSSLVLVNASTASTTATSSGWGRRSASARRRSTPSGDGAVRAHHDEIRRLRRRPGAAVVDGRRVAGSRLFGGTFDRSTTATSGWPWEVLEGLAPADLFLVPSARRPISRPGRWPPRRIASRWRRPPSPASTGSRSWTSSFAAKTVVLPAHGPEISGGNPGADLLFLIGADAFAEIATWHRYPDLLAACDFLSLSSTTGKRVPFII